MPDIPDQSQLDERIQQYYSGVFAEEARLSTRSAQGPLEFRRVQTLLAAELARGSQILDIGGARERTHWRCGALDTMSP